MIKKTILLLTTAAIVGLSACSASSGNDNQALTLAGIFGLQSQSSQEVSSANVSLRLPLGGSSAALKTVSGQFGVSSSAFTQSDVARVDIEVTGPGISTTVVAPLSNVGGVWSGSVAGVPVGSNRVFTAKAYDASNVLIYMGSAGSVTVDAYDAAEVYIMLQGQNQHADASNYAPLLESFAMSGNLTNPNDTISFAVGVTDEDVGDVITYSWVANGGSFNNAASATPVWTAGPSNGIFTITMTATDSKGAVTSFAVDVTVNDGTGSGNTGTEFNNVPGLTNLNALPTRLDLNETTTLSVVASDADGDSMTFSWTSNCGGTFSDASIQSPTFTAPASYPADNKCVLTIQVDDGRGGVNSADMTIHVLAPVVVGPLTPDPEPIADTQPPTLTALSFSTANMDTTSAGATVTVNVTIEDNERLYLIYPGVAVQFRNNDSYVSGSIMLANELPGGTSTKKSYQFDVVFPTGISGGDWLAEVVMADQAGNYVTLSNSDILNLGAGFDSKITNAAVTAGDTTGPQVTALTLSTASINTETQTQTVTINVTINEDTALIENGSGPYVTFDNGKLQRRFFMGNSTELPGGTSTQKSYQMDMVFPQNLAPGDWLLTVQTTDSLNNLNKTKSTELQSLGFDYRVVNTATVGDITGPTLAEFTITPGTVSLAQIQAGTQTGNIQLRIQDDFGFSSISPGVSILLVKGDKAFNIFPQVTDELPGGTLLDKSYDITFTYSNVVDEVGDWEIYVFAADELQNPAFLEPSDLQAASFQSILTVE